jgi:DNA-binding IclR family transcriptional regulator
MPPQSPAELPADLRAFLYSCIGSVAQLDLLARLRASGQAATVRELSALVGLPGTTVRHDLEALTARGLLRAQVGQEVAYRYAPTTPELARFGELAAGHYTENREAVIRFITARAARTFADAFKIRKDT